MKNRFGLVVFALLVAATGSAQLGPLDPTFGVDGVFLDECGLNAPVVNDLALATNGDLIIAGTAFVNGTGDWSVSRLTPAGELDSTFGVNGTVISNLPDHNEEGLRVWVQSDGKILLGARDFFNPIHFGCLVRLMPDGSPDPDFGVDGTLRFTHPNGSQVRLDDMILLPTGHIIVAYGWATAGLPSLHLIKFCPDGDLDTTFADGGALLISLPGTGGGAPRLTRAPNGDLIVISLNSWSGWQGTLAHRVDQNGDLLQQFGNAGVVICDGAPSGYAHSGHDIKIDQQGRFLVVGEAYGAAPPVLQWAARFNADGSDDPTFGTNGAFVIDLASPIAGSVRRVLPMADGSIYLVCGDDDVNTLFTDAVMLKLDANGGLDPGFGSGGVLWFPVSATTFLRSAVEQNNGQVLVAGHSGSGNRQVLASRLSGDLITAVEAPAAPSVHVAIAPNPTNGLVNIQFHLEQGSDVDLRLVDATGRTVHTPAIPDKLAAGFHNISADLTLLGAGGYWVVLRTGAGSAAEPVIVE